MKKIMMLVLVAAMVMPMVGCKEKSAADKAKDALKEAGAQAEKSADEAAKAVKEATK